MGEARRWPNKMKCRGKAARGREEEDWGDESREYLGKPRVRAVFN